jgi:hypothetical protein
MWNCVLTALLSLYLEETLAATATQPHNQFANANNPAALLCALS